MRTKFYLIFVIGLLFISCDKSELELQKERIRKDAAELKQKIDSTQARIDSGRKELDSLMYKIEKTTDELDSLTKRMNPLK
ncbi:MAG: hypothetical protein IPL53_25330 [Ignavibacteria bacterium]|nr:hypothetical protein [Ignavibacteria bacterium]